MHTAEENLEKICSQGFKVGGGERGVEVANGAAYGYGVYLGLQPDVSAGYTRGCGKMLLVEVFKGQRASGPQRATALDKPDRACAHYDVENKPFIVAFRPDQVIPRYIVRYRSRV